MNDTLTYFFPHSLDLYYIEDNGNREYSLVGYAWSSSACTQDKVSINEDTDSFFFVTSTAAHELGHK